MHDVISLVTFVSKQTTLKFVSVLHQMQLQFNLIDGPKGLASLTRYQGGWNIVLIDEFTAYNNEILTLLLDNTDGESFTIFSEDKWTNAPNLPENIDVVECGFNELQIQGFIYASWQIQYQRSKRFLDSPVHSFLSSNMIGQSQTFIATLQMVEKVARTDTSVYIFGETGTGKELAARAIHYESDRKDGPFIPINCGALSEELMLSELFGHEKGAFTGANRSHIGLLEQANHGTAFLDEIDSLSAKAQVTLLRYLQEREFRTVGGTQLKHTDTRILVASNKALDKLVLEKKFRMDLLFRLDVLRVDMPPLRERANDVFMLAQYFLDKLCHSCGVRKSLDKATVEWMLQYTWPGNIRELDNFIQRAYLLSEDAIIHMPQRHGSLSPATQVQSNLSRCTESIQTEKEKVLQAFELHYLSSVLTRFRGNVTHAAKFSGKERSCFCKLMKKHGLVREHFVRKSH